MTIQHQLKDRQQALLEELDELEEAIAEHMKKDQSATSHNEQLFWLQRQHTGVLVLLNEIERTLMESGEDVCHNGQPV